MRVTSPSARCRTSRVTRAAIGRWSLPVAGSDQEETGSTPFTMIWSIRAIGNDAGQLNPKPLPAAPCVERICEVTRVERAVVHRAVEVAEQDDLRQRLVGDGLAERVGAVVALPRP